MDESEAATNTLNVVGERGLCPLKDFGHIQLAFSGDEDEVEDINILIVEECENGFEGADLVGREVRKGPSAINGSCTAPHVLDVASDVFYHS